MSNFCYLTRTSEELIFWLGIMADHAQFIYNALPCSEAVIAQQALDYNKIFQQLQEQAYNMNTITLSFANQVAEDVRRLKNFKIMIVTRQLDCNITINLPPSIIQHMIDEADEFLLVLSDQCIFRDPTNFILHQHNFWLPDTAGHAALIRNLLDGTEMELIYTVSQYEHLFDTLTKRARTLAEMLATEQYMDYVPALHRLNKVSCRDTGMFLKFLVYLENLLSKCEVLSTANPLIANHMARESNYYINKIKYLDELNGYTISS